MCVYIFDRSGIYSILMIVSINIDVVYSILSLLIFWLIYTVNFLHPDMHMYEFVSREQNINFSGNLPYELNGSSLTWFTRFNRLYGLFLHSILIIGFMILYISSIFLIIIVWICITVFIIMIFILIIRSYNISKTSSFFTEGFQAYFNFFYFFSAVLY